MSKSPQIILITGANRSLGFAMLQVTAARLPSATYILACRTVSAGEEAVTELRQLGVTATIEVLQLDITQDDSVRAAMAWVKQKYGKLDILVNNAAVVFVPQSNDLSDYRSTYNATFNACITSVGFVTQVFLPLLHASENAKVINISSARGSLGLSTSARMPPTQAVAYTVSKTALNALTLEMQKVEDERIEKGDSGVKFYLACPGHCKTALNGFRGKKQPVEGAEVVVRLVMDGSDGEAVWEGGSYVEFEDGEMRVVPW